MFGCQDGLEKTFLRCIGFCSLSHKLGSRNKKKLGSRKNWKKLTYFYLVLFTMMDNFSFCDYLAFCHWPCYLLLMKGTAKPISTLALIEKSSPVSKLFMLSLDQIHCYYLFCSLGFSSYSCFFFAVDHCCIFGPTKGALHLICLFKYRFSEL